MKHMRRDINRQVQYHGVEVCLMSARNLLISAKEDVKKNTYDAIKAGGKLEIINYTPRSLMVAFLPAATLNCSPISLQKSIKSYKIIFSL